MSMKRELGEERNGRDSPKEYKMNDLRDSMKSLRSTSRLAMMENELIADSTPSRFSRENVINGLRGLSQDFVIYPDDRWYKLWDKFILIWAIYSTFFTPMEFAFFKGLPRKLFLLDICGQIAFLVDIVIQFFVAYRDSQTYKMVYRRTPIALRYLKSHFILDVLSCMPWDNIFKASGRKEGVRYLLWIRLSRVRRVTDFFQKMEKDIRINYLFTRIVKLITVELYCTHTAACIFYFLATTLPEEKEGYTWIGSLTLGDYSYSHFREIDLWRRYITSLYFAIVTMATVGYGDIHAVNLREMIFVMVYVSFDMILGAYLIGNMTALIVKGSKTVLYRDKMTDLMNYMNRNRLGRDIRSQIKDHLRLQYESAYTDGAVLQDLPISIRAKISQTLYQSCIENIPLFRECSAEFISQIVTRVHEEFFLPGEVIMEQGHVVDQLYFVCDGVLEEVGIGEDGSQETVALLEPNSSFGEISILCNIPQPYTVRVCELCRLIRIDKQSFSNILEIYFHDGRRILTNLLEGKDLRVKQLESDITFHIGKQEAELALKVNSTAYHGDLHQLKSLIRAGADPNKKDYDGRSPLDLSVVTNKEFQVEVSDAASIKILILSLRKITKDNDSKRRLKLKSIPNEGFVYEQHLSASRGYEDISFFLVKEGVDLNASDNFGNTPLFEAIKNGHDRVASLLVKEGAFLKIENAGSLLCTLVTKGDSDLLRRLLSNGIDANSKDYDHRTPLHVAASQGLLAMARLLLGAGASVFSTDRWGNTPFDEARLSGNNQLIKLLEEAKSAQTSEFPSVSHEISEKKHPRKCTVFPVHPWEPKDLRKHGVVLWVPTSMEELVTAASEQLNFPSGSCILSEDAGKILDIDMISDGQKLYLISETT